MDAILWFNEFSKGKDEFPVSSKVSLTKLLFSDSFSSYSHWHHLKPHISQSEDEIKKLTLEDNLGEVKRSFHIISKGQQIQKYAVRSLMTCQNQITFTLCEFAHIDIFQSEQNFPRKWCNRKAYPSYSSTRSLRQ